LKGCVLDTDVVIAALDRSDGHHRHAARAIRTMIADGVPLMMSVINYAENARPTRNRRVDSSHGGRSNRGARNRAALPHRSRRPRRGTLASFQYQLVSGRAGDGHVERSADLTHAVVTQPAKAFDEDSDGNALD
jgi:predicted nucleic acid-binding protein